MQLPDGQIFKFLGFSSLQPSENAACIYYTSDNQDFTRTYKLQIDIHQNVEPFESECHGYSEKDIRLIQQRIVRSLKNHDELVVIPKPEDVCELNDGGYCVLFNTVSETEAGNELFEKTYNECVKAIKDKKIDATSVVPITLHNIPTAYDIEWITNIMLSAKHIRVVVNSQNNVLYKIIHRIALKYGLYISSCVRTQTYIAGVPVTKDL